MLSVRGYEMYPLVYRSSAMSIARAAPIFRLDAWARKEVVLKGAGGLSFRVVLLILVTVPSLAPFTLAMTASPSPFSSKRLVLWWARNSSDSWRQSAQISQYGTGTKTSISISRSTMMARVGVWTRPTDRKSEPTWDEAMERNRVRTAPQTRSMICRASPADARSWSTSTSSAKASLTSWGVRAEKWERLTDTSPFSSRTTLRASTPISSPSLS